MLAVSSASAATFLSNGDITDGAGTTFGTWAFASAGTAGFGAASSIITTVGSSGVEFAYQNDGSDIADTLAAQITITAAAGFELDTITISQSVYENTDGNNGNPNGSTNYSVQGYDSTFAAVTGSNQISAPAVNGTNLEWTSASQIFNTGDAWSVTLTDVTSGTTVSYQETAPENLFQEWVSFDAEFTTSVPEPSSAALLGLGGLALLARRRRA